MPSSESDGQPPRKRSRTNANDGDDVGVGGKKARGRPRVDTQDATAADRRRTQIRLAQRAYRQRKETTISSLQDKNARLQSVIEQMDQTFQHFNDVAHRAGFVQSNSSLARQLSHVKENFAALVKSAAENNVDVDNEVAEVAEDVAAEVQGTSAYNRGIKAKDSNVGGVYCATQEELSPQVNASESPTKEPTWNSDILPPISDCLFGRSTTGSIRMSGTRTVGQTLDQGVSWTRPKNDAENSPQQLPFGLIDIRNQEQYPVPNAQHSPIYPINIPTPDVTPPTTRVPTPPLLASSLTKHLKTDWTYSHDETTFARRLTRAAVEAAFHLLSSSGLRREALDNVFKLSLPYKSLNDLRNRFKNILARGPDEDLNYWDSPFMHLGGAGTHYPRKDAKGNVVAIQNPWTVRRIGPISAKMIRVENSLEPSRSHDLNIDLTGLEGEWFDPHDVQGYLEQKLGCHIDPRGSFAEVMIDDDEHREANELEDYLYANRGPGPTHSLPQRSSDLSSEPPSLSTESSRTDITSMSVTPTHNVSSSSMDSLFPQTNPPYGLDMGLNLNNNFHSTDFSKYPDIDPSTFFDQPLGLDLAPGFDLTLNPNSSSLPQLNFDGEGAVDLGALGLDLMSGNGGSSLRANQVPAVRQKKKKVAWVDVSKLVDEIIKKGVCLGRTPGFRRNDVDTAFHASILMAS